MMCYRDRTFCPFNGCSQFNDCDRALTDKVKEDANRWWGQSEEDAPICQWTEKPQCYEEESIRERTSMYSHKTQSTIRRNQNS